MDIDLTEQLLAKHQKKPTIGRYSVSQLWGVLNGYITPEKWLGGESVSVDKALMMDMGSLKHKFVQELLPDWELEKKTEMGYLEGGLREISKALDNKLKPIFTLVGKCDGIKGDTIMEIKTSDKLIPQAKKWHEWQVKMYLSMFPAQIGIIYQPVFTSKKLYLKQIGEVSRNDKWFNKQLELINNLHKQLCEIQKKTQ